MLGKRGTDSSRNMCIRNLYSYLYQCLLVLYPFDAGSSTPNSVVYLGVDGTRETQ